LNAVELSSTRLPVNRNTFLLDHVSTFESHKPESHKIDTGNAKIDNLTIARLCFSDNLENNTGIGHEPQSLPVI